jgi:hypothetical protein
MMRSSQAFGIITLAAAGFALSACSSSNTAGPDLVAPAITQQPMGPIPTGPLKASDISRALSERKFNFSSAGRKGVVTYFGDGTFEYNETGKGTGTGIWQAADGKLCEARNPTSFLPKGTPSTCAPISSDGTRFTVGSMQLIPI